MTADEPPFVHPVRAFPGLTVIDNRGEWTPEELAEINARCDEIERARAQAEVSGRDYLIR